MLSTSLPSSALFFFNDTATTEIYTLSLHDALPIWRLTTSCADESRCSWPDRRGWRPGSSRRWRYCSRALLKCTENSPSDRKSTRLNSSHATISYAVFCLNKQRLL